MLNMMMNYKTSNNNDCTGFAEQFSITCSKSVASDDTQRYTETKMIPIQLQC